jgi:hypothetical protein
MPNHSLLRFEGAKPQQAVDEGFNHSVHRSLRAGTLGFSDVVRKPWPSTVDEVGMSRCHAAAALSLTILSNL